MKKSFSRRRRFALSGLLSAALTMCNVETALAGSDAHASAAFPSAPELHLRDMRGESHDLADYRGRVVLVNFWATWCTPCVREMPSLQRLQNVLGDRGFAVLAVNVAEPVRRLERYVAIQGLTFSVLLDPQSRAFEVWGVQALPTSFLVDRQGRVRDRIVGEQDWDAADGMAMVQELLDEAIQ